MKKRPDLSVVFLTSILFASAGRAATLLVPSQYPTPQAAVDAAQSGDTILISPQIPPPKPDGEVDPTWYTNQTTRIENKNLTIQGTIENFTNPVTFHNDHFAKVFEIVGSSQVTFRWLKIDGASRAIDLIPQGEKVPELILSQVRITDAVIAINGEAKVLDARNVSLNRNEGSAIKLKNFDRVNLHTVFASENVSTGITLQGNPNRTAEVTLQNVSASKNGFHGIWLASIRGVTQVNGSYTADNREVQFVITDSDHVLINGATLNDYDTDPFQYTPDGMRISKSKVTLSQVNADFYRSRLVQVLGCENDTEVEFLNSIFMTQYFNDIWSSGQAGNCATPKWNWFDISAPDDRIFSDGFESTDRFNNHCQDREIGEARLCRPLRVDGSASGFGHPGL